ncbi:MAG TPA: hypothetical protein VHR66_16235 [Gemmataceae bacterium]|jgi:hypothetical protein|nr:hypothetical protein [Gemmataceae bacterium]
MRRFAVLALLIAVAVVRAEQFDYYTNAVLTKAATDGSLKEVKELTSEQIADAVTLPDSTSAFIVVMTNDKRFAKLHVQSARQKIGKDQQAVLLLVDKYLTFKGTSDRAVQAQGQNLHVYPGLRMSLDIGQIVPEAVGGDLVVTADAKDANAFVVKPVKEAKLYLLVKPIPGVVPKKAPKLVVGEAFETRFIAGKYKLRDDGRRSGILILEVNESGEITGTFTSDKDGREYEVTGKAGTPKHAVSFTIKFPATSQTFTGFIFTGDGKAIAGTTKIVEREAGFVAERIED